MYYATAEEMAKLDDLAVASGLEIRQMMELAGWHMIEVFKQLGIASPASVSVLVGKGNKGGDGISAARHLKNHRFEVSIILTNRKISPDAQHHLDLALKMNIPVVDWSTEAHKFITNAQIIIDALVGYRLKGAPRGNIGEAVQFINELKDKKTVIAYDLPTGIEASTGVCHDPCVSADATLTLATPKKAQETAGAQHFGKVFIGDIGIPAFLYDKIAAASRPEFKSGVIAVI